MSRNSQIYTIAGILAVLTVCVVIITVMVAGCGKKDEPVSVSPDSEISESSSRDEESEEEISPEPEDESSQSESSQAPSSSAPIYYPPASSTPGTTTGTGSGSTGGSSGGSSSGSSSVSATLSQPGTVRNKTYSTLTIKSAVGDGNVKLENVKLTKKLIINGSDRVELVNCTIPEIEVRNTKDTVDLIAKGKTKVNSVVLYTNANLWEEDLSKGYEGFVKAATKTGAGYVRLKVGLYDTDLDSFKAGELTELSKNNSSVKSYLLSSNLVQSSSGSSGSGSSSSGTRYMNIAADDVDIDVDEEYTVGVYVSRESNGDDLSGVSIKATVKSGGDYVRFTDSNATTDRSGYAEIIIKGKAAGNSEIRITATKSGYTTEYKTIDVAVGQPSLQTLLNNAASSASKKVTLTRSYSVNNLTIPAGVTLEIPSGKTLTVNNGYTLTNNGTLSVKSGGSFSGNGGSAVANNGSVSNGGSLSFNGSAANYGTIANSGTLTVGGSLTNNVGYSISNTGTFTVNGSLVNNGSFTGNGVKGGSSSATLTGSTAVPGDFRVNDQGESFQANKTYTWKTSYWNRSDTPVTNVTVKSAEELKNALNNPDVTTITVVDNVSLTGDITIPAGKTVTIQNDKTFSVPAGKTLTINGTVNGAVKGADNTAKLLVNGTLTGASGPESIEKSKTYYWDTATSKWALYVDPNKVTSVQGLTTALKYANQITITDSFTMGSLTVGPNKSLTIDNGKILTIEKEVVIQGKVHGSIKGAGNSATLMVKDSGTLSGTTLYCNGKEETAYQNQTYTWNGSEWSRPAPTVEPTPEQELQAALQNNSAATTKPVALTAPLTVPADRTLTVKHTITGYGIQGEEEAKLIVNSGGSVINTNFQDGFGTSENVKNGVTYTWTSGCWKRDLDPSVTVTTQEQLATALTSNTVTTITINGDNLSVGNANKNFVVASGKTLTVTGAVTGTISGNAGAKLTIGSDGSLNGTALLNGFGETDTVTAGKTYTWNGSNWKRDLDPSVTVTTQDQLKTALDSHIVTAITINGDNLTVGTTAKNLEVESNKTLIVTGAVTGTVQGKNNAKLDIRSGGSVAGTFYYKDGSTPKDAAAVPGDTYTWTVGSDGNGKWVGTATAPSASPADGGDKAADPAIPSGAEVLPPNPDDQPGLA